MSVSIQQLRNRDSEISSLISEITKLIEVKPGFKMSLFDSKASSISKPGINLQLSISPYHSVPTTKIK
jgi:hypothetical protein